MINAARRIRTCSKIAMLATTATLTFVFALSLLSLFIILSVSVTLDQSRLEIVPYQPPMDHHDLIFRKATHQTTKAVTVRVPLADHRGMKHAIATDIERHGGRITRGAPKTFPPTIGIQAVVSKEYAEHLLRKTAHSGQYLTPGHAEWAQEIQQGTRRQELAGPPLVEVNIVMFPMPYTNWPIVKPTAILAVISATSLGLLLVQTGFLLSVAAVKKAIRYRSAG